MTAGKQLLNSVLDSKSILNFLFSFEYSRKKLLLHWGIWKFFGTTAIVTLIHDYWIFNFQIDFLKTNHTLTSFYKFFRKTSFLPFISAIIWKLSNLPLYVILPLFSSLHILFLMLMMHFSKSCKTTFYQWNRPMVSVVEVALFNFFQYICFIRGLFPILLNR